MGWVFIWEVHRLPKELWWENLYESKHSEDLEESYRTILNALTEMACGMRDGLDQLTSESSGGVSH
jgi:hypothetical protein